MQQRPSGTETFDSSQLESLLLMCVSSVCVFVVVGNIVKFKSLTGSNASSFIPTSSFFSTQ